MSLEKYAIHLVDDGDNPTRLAAKKVIADRQAAHAARIDYAKSKGAAGIYGRDSNVAGLLWPVGTGIPAGWRKESGHSAEHCIIVPAKKTPAGKAFAQELADLPFQPGNAHFSEAIGAPAFVFVGGRMLTPYFEFLSESYDGPMFVMIPWQHAEEKDRHEGIELTPQNRKAFTPPGSSRVLMSRYYAMKEDAELPVINTAAP